ncbi:MAG: hypothetical protein NTX03_04965 [Bacteroidetes bacterium]|nr:hypothetical protein [Bacteroidota bacterium]
MPPTEAADRDVLDLTPRGITALRLTAFDTQTTAFSMLPADESMVGDITDAVTAKNLQRTNLIKKIQDILGIAEGTFGLKSGSYHSFKPCDLNALTDAELYFLCDTIETRATHFLVAMTPKGLTAGMVTALDTNQADFKAAMKLQGKLEGDRDLATELRHIDGNALFDELSDMNQTARNFWINTDEAKANDYIIYDSPNQQNRTGAIPGMSVISRAFTGIVAGSNFTIWNDGPESFEVYFSLTDNGVPVNGIMLPIPANQNQATTAAALGFDSGAGITHFCIRNTGVNETRYRVRLG